MNQIPVPIIVFLGIIGVDAILVLVLMITRRNCIDSCDRCGKDIMKDEKYWSNGDEVLCEKCYRIIEKILSTDTAGIKQELPTLK